MKSSVFPRTSLLAVTIVGLALAVAIAFAPSTSMGGTLVPGHDRDRYDQDNNGYPDEGVTTVGKYTALYAEDINADWYWDLGDGRILGSVGSVDDLDAATLTVCDYQITYRANFENDPYMNSGWITNLINCHGYEDTQYNYLIVHETDPRYEGNPDWAVWGTWEYHIYAVSGYGNLVQPMLPVGAN